jgi:hypothetical protein
MIKLGQVVGLRELVRNIRQDAREQKRARQEAVARKRAEKHMARIKRRQEQTGYTPPLRQLEAGQHFRQGPRAGTEKISRGGKGKQNRTKRDAAICPYRMTRGLDAKTRAIGAAQALELHKAWGACDPGRWSGNTWFYPAWTVTPKTIRRGVG